jgi:ribonuclease HI
MSETGGWAAIILLEEKEIFLSGRKSDTTHQRMELTAAIETLRYLQKLGVSSHEVVIYTDSQYLAGLPARKNKLVAMGLMTKKKQRIANSDLLLEIFALMNDFRVLFLKIPSHQKVGDGDVHNREVDRRSRKIVRDYIRNTRLKTG